MDSHKQGAETNYDNYHQVFTRFRPHSQLPSAIMWLETSGNKSHGKRKVSVYECLAYGAPYNYAI